MFKILYFSIKYKWVRAAFLDFLINEIHISYYNKKKPNFSSVFFNAGAHVQHHYLFLSYLVIIFCFCLVHDRYS